MNTKEKPLKPRTKKPKPNLHGPNSPTPKNKVAGQVQEDDEPVGSFYTKNDDGSSEN